MAADSRGGRGGEPRRRGVRRPVGSGECAASDRRARCRLRNRPRFARCPSWDSHTAPTAPAFSMIRDRRDGSIELSTTRTPASGRTSGDSSALAESGSPATGCPPCRLRPDMYLRLRAWRDQGDLPVFVARARRRQWWWWRDAFYWESGDCEPEDIRAILVMLERHDEQGLEWEFGLHLAEPIPEGREAFRVRARRWSMPSLRIGRADPVQPRHPAVDERRQRARESAAPMRGMHPSIATRQGRSRSTAVSARQQNTFTRLLERGSPDGASKRQQKSELVAGRCLCGS